MKSIHIKIYICGLGLMMSLGSCKKYLNLSPENNTYDEVFWVDANNISKATNGAYSLLRSSLRDERSYFIFGDLAGGNFTVGEDHWNQSDLSKEGGYLFSYAPYLETSLWNWTRFYEVINQCNLIIDKTPSIPDDKFDGGKEAKNSLIAEAKFIRAYVNFYMQRVWGDILLIKESLKDPQVIPPVARSSQEATLAFCIEDLTFAIANLNTNGSKAVASKGAAQALLAHIYAWKHDYKNAEIIATEVINSDYSLEEINDYRKIWSGQSKESIFEINMLYNTSGDEYSKDFFSIFLSDPTIKDKNPASSWTIDEHILTEYFNQNEPRFEAISKKGSSESEVFLRKYDNVIYYNPNDEEKYAVSNNLVLLRLADIYLLRAEAFYKNGKEGQARTDLNLIRNRAGLPSINPSGEDLFLEIFKERRRELIGEGCTQFDVIRMELFTKLEDFSRDYSVQRIQNQGYYWPLHMRELLPQNELLTQNPWWKNH